jgi:hypothetical protein
MKISDERLVYFSLVIFFVSIVGFFLTFLVAEGILSMSFFQTNCYIQPTVCGNPDGLTYDQMLYRQLLIFGYVQFSLVPIFFVIVYGLARDFWFKSTNLKYVSLKVLSVFSVLWLILLSETNSLSRWPVLLVACVSLVIAIQIRVSSYKRRQNVT